MANLSPHPVLLGALTTLLAMLLLAAARPVAAPLPPVAVVVADSDADGVPDLYDACPGSANIGTPDQDGDGVVDRCDLDADGDGRLDRFASIETPLTPGRVALR